MTILREDAAITQVFGVSVYQFGLWVALGALLAVGILVLLALHRKAPASEAALEAVLCLGLGLVMSRLFFGVMDATLGQVMPLWAMTRLNTGGYSLYGALAGACLGMWITARVTRGSTAVHLDALAPAFMIFTAFERFAEQYIEEFGLSRGLVTSLFAHPWIAVADDYDTWFLMTWRIECAIALILFVILLIDAFRKHRPGHTFFKMMLLFGGTQIIMESLRYDQHMTIRSFVRMEQVLSMVLLGTALIILAVRRLRSAGSNRALPIAALVSIPVVTGLAVAIEFMIDRTDISRILLYIVFIALVAVPVTLGFRLLKEDRA